MESEVQNQIVSTHRTLNMETDTKEKAYYGTAGRNPSTLMDYIKNETGWEIEELDYDIDIDLDLN